MLGDAIHGVPFQKLDDFNRLGNNTARTEKNEKADTSLDRSRSISEPLARLMAVFNVKKENIGFPVISAPLTDFNVTPGVIPNDTERF